MLLNKIKKEIDKAKVISFDIFDTLLVRPYLKPTDLFSHIEQVSGKIGFEKERRSAEERAFVARKNGIDDITFNMIYDEINDDFKDLKQKEMDWEEMILRENPELKQVYNYAKSQGKKIVIASDMYLPTEFIAKVLNKNGYNGWDKLYVSGDIGKKKRTGLMYKQIMFDLNCQPQEIFHIGDNPVSDYEVVKKLKINAYLYKSILDQYINTVNSAKLFMKIAPHTLGKSILLSMMAYFWIVEYQKNNNSSNYLNWMGYNYSGPLGYGLARFVFNQAIKDNINHLLFIARDGYSLWQIFKTFDSNIKASYVYANRKIRQLTSLDTDTLIEHLALTIDYCSAQDKEIKKLAEKTLFLNKNDYKIFVEKNKHKLEQILQVNRDNYKRYINHLVQKSKNVAIVDTMAHSFSSQKLIDDFLPTKTRGYYWVYTKQHFGQDINCISFAETQYQTQDLKQGNLNLYTKKWALMESFFSAPEVAIDNIDEKGKPVYRQNPPFSEQKRASNYEYVADYALRFAQEIKELFSNQDCFFDFKTLVCWVNCLIDAPDEATIQYFQQYPGCLLINQDKPNHIYVADISWKDYLFHIKRSKKIIANTLWKTNFQKWYVKNWWIFKEKTTNLKIKKFFGITLKSKEINGNILKKKYLSGFIKIKKTPKYKNIYLFGIKIWSKKNMSYEFEKITKKILFELNEIKNELKTLKNERVR